METEIIKKIREFVEEECGKNDLGIEIFENHLISVVNFSKKLAIQKKADLEIVEIAAWLHDLGSVIYGRKDHHITGVEIAKEKLKEFNYPEEKIEKIKKCILNHRGSINNFRETLEEQIIAEADSISFFNNFEGYILWVIEKEKIKNQKLIRKSIIEKVENKYNQLSPEGQELIKLKYEAVMLLFG